MLRCFGGEIFLGLLVCITNQLTRLLLAEGPIHHVMKELEAAPSALPELCRACLGPGSAIRMVRDDNGRTCRLCHKPFTSYRWDHQRRTIFCPLCAGERRACQCCLLDKEYMIPLPIRDAALKVAPPEQTKAVLGIVTTAYRKKHHALEPGPTIERDDNPEKAISRLLSVEGIGLNGSPKETVLVLGIEDDITEKALERRLGEGKIKSIKLYPKARCAFVEFESPKDASQAVGVEMKDIVDGIPLWFRFMEKPLVIAPEFEAKIGRMVRKAMRKG